MPSAKINLRDRLEDTQLDLSMSEIDEVPVKDIAAIKKATHLDLSNNNLKSLGKNFAPLLTHLIKLDLSKNHLTELPDNFGELVNLRHLDLYSNKLTFLPLSFGELKMLRWLDLKNNPLMPKLSEIAGPCLDNKQCQDCAKKVVNSLQAMQVHVAEERQLIQKRKQQEMADLKKKEQQQQQQQQSQKNKKKKKAEKSSGNTHTKSENGNTNITSNVGNIDNPKKESAKHCRKCESDKMPSVMSRLFRLVKFMFLGAFLTLMALLILYVYDENRFRLVQAHAVKTWEETVAKLPIQVIETGQKVREITQPTVTYVWNKTAEIYVWFNTDPTLQEYVGHGRALWSVLINKIYDIYRTVNQQIPVYVETVKKKIF